MNLDALSDADLQALDAGNYDAMSDAGLKALDAETSKPSLGSIARSFNSGLVNGIPNAIDTTAALGASGIEKLANLAAPGTFKDTSVSGNMQNAVMGPALNHFLNTEPYQPRNAAESYANAAGRGLAGSLAVPGGSAATTVAGGIFGGLGAQAGSDLGQTQVARDWLGDYASPALGLAGGIVGGGAAMSAMDKMLTPKAEMSSLAAALPPNSKETTAEIAPILRDQALQAKNEAREQFTLAKKSGLKINGDALGQAVSGKFIQNLTDANLGFVEGADPKLDRVVEAVRNDMAGPMSVDHIQAVRNKLGTYIRGEYDPQKGYSPSGLIAINMRAALDNTLDQAAQNDLVTSGSASGITAFQKGLKQWADYRKTYTNSDVVRKLVNGDLPTPEQAWSYVYSSPRKVASNLQELMQAAGDQAGDVKYLTKAGMIQDMLERSKGPDGEVKVDVLRKNITTLKRTQPTLFKTVLSSAEQKLMSKAQLAPTSETAMKFMGTIGGEAALSGLGAAAGHAIAGLPGATVGAGAGAAAGRGLKSLGAKVAAKNVEGSLNDMLGSVSGVVRPRVSNLRALAPAITATENRMQ